VARIVVVVVSACLLLVLTADPGSGTGVNLHRADDVAALVVGAHHAKPVPPAPVVRHTARVVRLVAAAFAVLLACLCVGSVDAARTGGSDPSARRASRRFRRGPPALA
jgi:hypothetical protein